jgi:presenilin-like A22 family membrane protease
MEEEVKKELTFPVNPWRILVWEVFLFLLTFVLGISTAYRLNIIAPVEKIEATPSFFSKFILSTAFAIAIVLLIIRFVKSGFKKRFLFRTIFLLAFFFGSLLFFEVWLGEPIALILLLFLVFLWIKMPNIFTHDLLLISSMAGLGSFLGLGLMPEAVAILLIIFSLYDVIAVYKTRHMVKMAKEMTEAGALPGLILPSKFSELKTPLEKTSLGGNFLILGGGDIVFPLLFSVSVLQEGISKSVIIAFFSLFGLLASFWLFFRQKERRAIPALPPIAFFSIIGYLITLFFKS